MRIGEFSRQTGCHIETIRYYERIGVIPKPPYTLGGHRSYRHDDLQGLLLIRGLRGLGMSLKDVRRLVPGSEEGNRVTIAEFKRLLETQVSLLDRRLGAVRTLLGKCDGGTNVSQVLETFAQEAPVLALTKHSEVKI